jgi:8-oxo-dGTP pyrophosphatase MutT (NUDIX family)
MVIQMIKQLPLAMHGGRKGDMRSQFAALCYRVINDKIQVLMITSRGTGRWIVPKGWPMDGHTPAQSALQEAWEEAGVHGQAQDFCLGLYSYRKIMEGQESLPCAVMVYPVQVTSLASDYPEKGERKREWMSRKKAAGLVAEPELARIISDFDPRLWR